MIFMATFVFNPGHLQPFQRQLVGHEADSLASWLWTSCPGLARLPVHGSAPSVLYRDLPDGKTGNSSHKTSNKTLSTTCLDEIWQENSGIMTKTTVWNQEAPQGTKIPSWAKGGMANLRFQPQLKAEEVRTGF